MSPLDALAVLLILAIFCAGIIATHLRAKPFDDEWEWRRVGTIDGIPHFERVRKPRHDAAHDGANADRFTINQGRN